MPDLQATDISDAVAITQNELGRLKFTDLISGYQNTIAFKRLFRKKKTTFDSGNAIEFRVMTDHNNSARFVPLGYTAIVDIPNNMTYGTVPWRHVTWNWALERRLVNMNRAPSKIFDMVKKERIGSLASAIIKIERAFWRVPAADDNVTPYGIPYYVVKSNTATTTNEGFNGGAPTGYTTVAGLSPTTYPRWKNFATQYTAVTKDDLIRKMRRAMWFTNFEPLVENTPTYSTGYDYGIYTNYEVLATLEEILEAQNENLGNDIAPKDGMVRFRGVDLMAVKDLNDDVTNPVYGINWGDMDIVGLRGEWMKETNFDALPNQPTVSVTHVDCTYNLLCRNRRTQWVVATNTGLPA